MFYQPGTYEDLHSLGQYLRDGLTLVFAEHELVAQIMGDGPLAQVVFSADSFRLQIEPKRTSFNVDLV
tara:strand:+ start:299 stop:502 length:204 start_codon:yes stop_codon:yes gene_type:complete